MLKGYRISGGIIRIITVSEDGMKKRAPGRKARSDAQDQAKSLKLCRVPRNGINDCSDEERGSQ